MRIRDRQCETCIYRPGSPLRADLPRLEDAIRDPRMPGHFARARACHGERYAQADVICAGFAARHGDDCTPVQIVRRLTAVGRRGAGGDCRSEPDQPKNTLTDLPRKRGTCYGFRR